jgi:hypothetical protein
LPLFLNEDEEPAYMFSLGYYSEHLLIFLDLDEHAIEESYEILAYTILQDEDGDTIPIVT